MNVRLLLVDDDRVFADVLCRRLLNRGYEVTEVHHPRQAVEAASLRDYDVAILGRDLPEFSSPRLVELLAGHVADLQIVFLSHREDEHEPAGRSCPEGTFCVSRPCRFADVDAAIEQAIGCRRRARRRYPGGTDSRSELTL